MKIQICTIGGYSEVGKNMTAIKIGEEVIICDMGFYLPKVITYEEEGESIRGLSKEQLIEIGAAPDDNAIKDWQKQVKAIVVSHCHLDHIGLIPYMAHTYNCPVIGTPYTIEVLKSLYFDEKIRIRNSLKTLNPNATFRISPNIKIEFINTTHSTPQTVMIAIHTPKGTIVYANDFKFDDHPIIGKKPNYSRLKEIGRKGALVLIVDSLYSDKHQKTPSERVAKQMLQDVMLGTDNKGHAVIVTTFASHLARLKSIIEFGKRMHRKIIFLGRSLHKYITSAERIKLVNFTQDIGLYRGKEMKKKLQEIAPKKGKYLIVCTGNQGEPNSTLVRMAAKELPFNFEEGDQVIFSCRTIPEPTNIANRALLEEKLRRNKVRIFKDIHCSGHASREDHRDLITMLKPKHIIPAHGDVSKLTPLADLATEMGYVLGETVHIMRDGQKMELN